MSAALQQRPMTVAEFLAWEERQPIRYEFDGVRPVAMAGGSLPHAIIGGNIYVTLFGLLRGKPCRPFNSDAKVSVAGSIRYPDVSVSCSEQTAADLTRQGVVHQPVVVFEVLSESTSVTDRTDKNAECQATASILRYVMLEQDRMAATVFARVGDDWVGHLILGVDAVLSMPEVGIEAIRLAHLYEGVVLPGPERTDVAR
jgi:Uma2 family endonuclease